MHHQKLTISEYYSDDLTKKAEVIQLDRGYVIDFYLNNEYNHSITYTSKSLQYVEDAAENYVMGHFPNYKDFTEV